MDDDGRAAMRRPRAARTLPNQSMGKGLQLLDYFRAHGQGRLTDLAAYAGLNASTALRLALTLEARGALVREPASGRYALGPWILELAASLLREQPLLKHAHEALVHLRDATGETASLWVRDGVSRVCLDRVESPHGLRGTFDVGARLPPHRGAAGKVILASLSADEREVVVRGIEREMGERLDALRAELDAVRAQGYAFSFAERAAGVASVAVPIAHPIGRVAAVLNLSGPLDRLDRTRMEAAVPLLQRAAEQLSLRTFGLLQRD